jgi:hypothetical protein
VPYTDDPDFSKELNDDDMVWRYVNFAKYADLLERKKQYFVSGSKLQESDPYEGYFQKIKFANQERLTDKEKQLFDHMDKHERDEKPKSVFINCWHINEIESDAMWKIYATVDAGIAIQTTVKKLKASFHVHPQRVYIRKVHYVDNKKKDTSISWIPHRFSRKGISFSHERELRIFVEGTDNMLECVSSEDGKVYGYQVIPQEQRTPIERNDDGIYVKVDLSDFIEKIYVSPLSKEWFLDLVKAITKKYGLHPDIVEKSDLYSKPPI